jgi:sugar lactone lactonase YvrE
MTAASPYGGSNRRDTAMSRTSPRRPLLALLALALGLGLLVPPAQARTSPHRLALPDGFQPEGIAIGHRPVAYLGSLVDGDIYRLDLRTGAGRVISQGPGTPSVGLKVDRRGRLFVAGGSGGDGRVVDTRTGKVLASYHFADAPTFINDVVLTRRAAYFTDSSNAQLYRVPLGRHVATQAQVTTIPLGGEWEQTPGFNANGIARTPDGRALLVVQSSTGFLFRVSPRTGSATRVDLGSTLLTNGDGLLVKGRTLYAVQNQLNRIAVVRLGRCGRSGTLQRTITSPDFDVPTTVARFRGSLYLPNARFGTPPTPTTEYAVVRVRR